jgi:hypothetical protein
LHIRSTRKLTLNEAPIVTVTGKAFWDIGHASKDQSNRRKNLPGYAVWEIHPVPWWLDTERLAKSSGATALRHLHALARHLDGVLTVLRREGQARRKCPNTAEMLCRSLMHPSRSFGLR